MPFKDPEVRKRKQAEYSKAYYERNRETVIAKINKNKRANRAWFTAYKKTLSCIECGENHPATLDFHHVEARKSKTKVNDLVSDGHARPRILEEIAKCVVLCSNCHRKHHHNERIHRKKLAKAKKSTNIHTINNQKGTKMATKKNWIAGAIKKPGALKESLGVKKGEKIPAKTLEKASKAPGKMGQRARLAQTLKGFKK
jgi:uncharacterized protein YifE (UPF0438 family)